jgi:hypothetical protein
MNCLILYISNDWKHVASCERIPLSIQAPHLLSIGVMYLCTSPLSLRSLQCSRPPETHQLLSCTSPRKNGAYSLVVLWAPLAAKSTNYQTYHFRNVSQCVNSQRFSFMMLGGRSIHKYTAALFIIYYCHVRLCILGRHVWYSTVLLWP